jgi:O-antigen/teichoic acid export membrane protein
MALVALVIQGLQMFSDLGIRQCVIQHPRGDEPVFLNTAWTVQVLRGAILFLGSLALAWPMAAFYEESNLLWLVPLAGLGALVYGFSSTSLLTYSREVRRGPLVRREVGVYVVTYTAVVAAVWLLRQSWPGGGTEGWELVIIATGMIVAPLGEVLLSFTLRPAAPHRFEWEPEARRELLQFGGWVFVSSACTFLAAQADRLMVGKLSLETLGVYHIAVVIVALPVGVVMALAYNLAFPLMSDTIRGGEPADRAFRRSHRGLLVVSALLLVGLASVGPPFVRLFYDDRYETTAALIRYLAIAAWFTAILIPGELALLALGDTRGLAMGQVVRLAFVSVLLPGGYWLAGLPGLIVGVALGELVRYAVLAVYLDRAGIRAYRADAALTALAGVLLGAYVLAEQATGAQGWGAVPILGAILQTLFWAALYVAWAAPARLPHGLRWMALRRTKPDGVSP